MIKFRSGFGALMIICSLISCKQDDICLLPQTIRMVGGFAYNTSDTSYVLKDTFVENSYITFATDTQILKNASQFSIALSPVHDSTRVIFVPDSTQTLGIVADTIIFRHTAVNNFISIACGFNKFYTLQQVQYTHHFIDSVTINNNSVNDNVNTQHIQWVLAN